MADARLPHPASTGRKTEVELVRGSSSTIGRCPLFAQKRDIADPPWSTNSLPLVGTPKSACLALYLLTVADALRGTSPKVWNNWKARLLEQLVSGSARTLLNASGDIVCV